MDLIEDLEEAFGEPAKVLFPGAVYFTMPVRLARDMTESTDWDLIFPLTKEKLNETFHPSWHSWKW